MSVWRRIPMPDRIAIVRQATRAGRTPGEIARFFGAAKQSVRRVAEQAGIEIEPPQWPSRSIVCERGNVTLRAADGARKALEAIRASRG